MVPLPGGPQPECRHVLRVHRAGPGRGPRGREPRGLGEGCRPWVAGQVETGLPKGAAGRCAASPNAHGVATTAPPQVADQPPSPDFNPLALRGFDPFSAKPAVTPPPAPPAGLRLRLPGLTGLVAHSSAALLAAACDAQLGPVAGCACAGPGGRNGRGCGAVGCPPVRGPPEAGEVRLGAVLHARLLGWLRLHADLANQGVLRRPRPASLLRGGGRVAGGWTPGAARASARHAQVLDPSVASRSLVHQADLQRSAESELLGSEGGEESDEESDAAAGSEVSALHSVVRSEVGALHAVPRVCALHARLAAPSRA